MASGPISSWQIDGETVKTVSDFILGGSKITADGDCSHEIKRHLLLGRKVTTNLDSILKSRDITLSIKVCLVKAMVFPVVMYGCESWTVKKVEHLRTDAFDFWCRSLVDHTLRDWEGRPCLDLYKDKSGKCGRKGEEDSSATEPPVCSIKIVLERHEDHELRWQQQRDGEELPRWHSV